MQAGDILTEAEADYIEALEKAYDTFMGPGLDAAVAAAIDKLHPEH